MTSHDDGESAVPPESKETMNIATAAAVTQKSEQDVWASLRSYLNLQVPLAAVLRRPYAFIRQGAGQGQGSKFTGPGATVLPFRKPNTPNNSISSNDDKETP